MTLQEFNSKYEYKTDLEKYGRVEVWELPVLVDGKYIGDCESYVRALRNYVPEFKDWKYYYCILNGGGHCLLYKNGDVIDCNTKIVVTFEQYCRMFSVKEFKKYNWFVVASKILISKVQVLWGKLLK